MTSWNKGISHSETTKEKIRLACLKSKVGSWNKNKKKTKKWIEKISQSKLKYFQTHKTWNKGIPCSEATKEKISQTLIRKYGARILTPWNKEIKVKSRE
jgi:hypothetical protein